MLLVLLGVLLAAVWAGDDEWPQDVETISVTCPVSATNFFKCSIVWPGANSEEEQEHPTQEEWKARIIEFIGDVKARADAKDFFSGSSDKYAAYQGADLYESALTFFGLDATTMPLESFLGVSYFLEYYSKNTFAVAMRDEKEPVIGFSGGVYAPLAKEGEENNEQYYNDEFMNALRNITVQYKISIDSNPNNFFYAIGYMGTFSIPYFFSPVENTYLDKFSFAYNIDYNWATEYDGSYMNFTDIVKDSTKRGVPPGVMMVKFIAPTFSGAAATETQKMNGDRFKKMFADTYGLVVKQKTNEMGQLTADNEERYTKLNGSQWNFCRSLGRNNVADAAVDTTNTDEEYLYDYVAPLPDTPSSITCNQNSLPSFFFMTHNLTTDVPYIYSTKYQLMTDGSCQYRTDLKGNGHPETTHSEVEYGHDYSLETEEEPALPTKNVFVMNGEDFMALHVVEKRADGSDYNSYNYVDNSVAEKYYYYELNADHIDNVYYDNLSMCNTAISDTYVLYDMKEYASVYGAIGAITDDSFGYENVYAAMKTYPTKSNYTAVVTAASVEVDDDNVEQVNVKTQLQKCVNVFLDTEGKEVSACNDVTSTWDWGVFAGSLVGIIIVVGLWVWGGLYSKAFKAQSPSWYTDLVNYEPEWKRIDEKEKAAKAAKKAAKK